MWRDPARTASPPAQRVDTWLAATTPRCAVAYTGGADPHRQALGQLAITCAPSMNTVFDTAPTAGAAWPLIFTVAAAASTITARSERRRGAKLPTVRSTPVPA